MKTVASILVFSRNVLCAYAVFLLVKRRLDNMEMLVECMQ